MSQAPTPVNISYSNVRQIQLDAARTIEATDVWLQLQATMRQREQENANLRREKLLTKQRENLAEGAKTTAQQQIKERDQRSQQQRQQMAQRNMPAPQTRPLPPKLPWPPAVLAQLLARDSYKGLSKLNSSLQQSGFPGIPARIPQVRVPQDQVLALLSAVTGMNFAEGSVIAPSAPLQRRPIGDVRTFAQQPASRSGLPMARTTQRPNLPPPIPTGPSSVANQRMIDLRAMMAERNGMNTASQALANAGLPPIRPPSWMTAQPTMAQRQALMQMRQQQAQQPQPQQMQAYMAAQQTRGQMVPNLAQAFPQNMQAFLQGQQGLQLPPAQRQRENQQRMQVYRQLASSGLLPSTSGPSRSGQTATPQQGMATRGGQQAYVTRGGQNAQFAQQTQRQPQPRTDNVVEASNRFAQQAAVTQRQASQSTPNPQAASVLRPSFNPARTSEADQKSEPRSSGQEAYPTNERAALVADSRVPRVTSRQGQGGGSGQQQGGFQNTPDNLRRLDVPQSAATPDARTQPAAFPGDTASARQNTFDSQPTLETAKRAEPSSVQQTPPQPQPQPQPVVTQAQIQVAQTQQQATTRTSRPTQERESTSSTSPSDRSEEGDTVQNSAIGSDERITGLAQSRDGSSGQGGNSGQDQSQQNRTSTFPSQNLTRDA